MTTFRGNSVAFDLYAFKLSDQFTVFANLNSAWLSLKILAGS